MDAPGRMLAGEIGKPFGLSGDVYVMRISDDPRRFEPGARLIGASGQTLVVETSRPHGNRWLVKFAGVDDRNAAEAIRGAVFIPTAEVRALDEDEFWPHELIGCRVLLTTGRAVGIVADVVPGPAQDLLQISTPAGERLVPAVKGIVVAVDVGARRITIDPPEGLVD